MPYSFVLSLTELPPYFRSMSKISIGVALAEIDQSVIDGRPQTFSLRYVKKDGSIGSIERARKNVKHPKAKSSAQSFNHNIKESGTLLVYAEDKGGYREIKIDLITHYNGIKIFHG